LAIVLWLIRVRCKSAALGFDGLGEALSTETDAGFNALDRRSHPTIVPIKAGIKPP
jgi:hypothetical protein